MHVASTTPPDYHTLLLEASAEFLLIIEADSLNIRAANPHLCKELGYTAEQLQGQAISEYECALTDLFFWEEMATARQGEEKTVESSLRCADGSVLDIIKTVRCLSETPDRLYTLRGTPVAQQKKAAYDLAHMSLRLHATLEATADGILFIDCDGHILNMNRRFSKMWELPPELLLDPNDKAIFRHMASQFSAASYTDQPAWMTKTSAFEDRFDTLHLADGRVYEQTIGIARESEQIIGRVVSYRDVTEHHRIQQELIAAHEEVQRASRAKDEFFAMMSHEIRTPLNGIIGINELMLDGKLAPEQREYAKTISSSAEALLVIINDILDFSKIEAGRLQIEKIPFDLHQLLHDIALLHAPRARDKGIGFHLEIAHDVPSWIISDPTRLRQIVANFLSNAIKFTSLGAVELIVSRTMDTPTAQLRFSVRDSGLGMSPEVQSKLFAPFTQADSSTTRRFGGTGLGLAITLNLTKLLGGSIQLESAEGRGSTFTSLIPLIETTVPSRSNHTPQKTDALDDTGSTPHQTARLLLVEDNPTNQTVAIGTLHKLGYTDIEVAINGAIAVEQARQHHFDAILMDCQMPVMDGYTATATLRAEGYTLPIIAMTANAMQGDREKCLDAGMNDFVPKPIRRQELEAALSRWIHVDAIPTPHAIPATSAPSATAAMPTSTEVSPAVFDRNRALALYDGDVNLLNLIVDAFVSDTPLTLEKLHATLTAQDANNTRIHAHGIKGAAASAGAECVRATAWAMETAAKHGQLEQVAELLPTLEQQFAEFRQSAASS